MSDKPLYIFESAQHAAMASMARTGLEPHEIQWTDRPADWPERSKT